MFIPIENENTYGRNIEIASLSVRSISSKIARKNKFGQRKDFSVWHKGKKCQR